MDWEELETAVINTNNKELVVDLSSEVKYESETWDHIKRLATLCKQVYVPTLRLSEGRCEGVYISTNKIEMWNVSLNPGVGVNGLHHLLSQYESWVVYGGLYLTELRSDDWALLAQLLPTLTWVERVVITNNSTSQPAQKTLRQLWNKTNLGWEVNNEKYKKSDVENFDKMFNKHFSSDDSLTSWSSKDIGGPSFNKGVEELKKVRTLYACVAEVETELSFEPNQIITNVRPSLEPGWLVGILEGRVGLLPENYVEFIT